MKKLLFWGAFVASALAAMLPALAQPQPPLPRAAASLDAGSVHVDRYGKIGRPVVVFIPGLTCGPWEWSREIALFSRTNTVYALTLPGFDGLAPISKPLFDTVSGDIWNAFDREHVSRALLIGHSLGGTLAIALASQHPERLRGVAALDGLPIFPGAERETQDQRLKSAAQFRAIMASATTPQAFEASQRMTLPYLVTAPEDADAIAKRAARSDPQASGAWAAEDVLLDLRPALRRITVPLLEIAPFDKTLDTRLFPTAQAKAAYYASLLANDPDARVETIENSRHFAMYDNPGALDAALQTFVASLP